MRIVFSFCILLLTAGAALASSEPGDEVVVVYNKRLRQSKEIAEHYAAMRQVPSSQVFGFSMTTNPEMSRAQFHDSLERPLAKKLVRKHLWEIGLRPVPATEDQPARSEPIVVSSKIRYAVLCYGVPYKIAPDLTLKEPGEDKLRPELRRNEAAVDSELALLPLMERHLPLDGPLRNPVYNATNAASIDPTNGVLMVARLDGPSAAIADHLVDKAIEAETRGMWGRAYFDLRDTTAPGYKAGDDMLRDAAAVCERLGFETTVDNQPATFRPGFPMSNIAFYAGWYDENVSGPFTRPKVEFMPGAFAYHLHSFSAANLRSAKLNWVGPLLAKGATISMGCVYEPYLGGTPDIASFTVRFLFSGFSFGEAAYADQRVLSWQTTVVGDPLYRPFGRNLDKLTRRLQERNDPFLQWAYLRLLDLNVAAGKPATDAASILEQLPLTKTSPILSEKLGGLYESLGKPSSAADMFLQALKLDPSPQQRLRLRLTLGSQLPPLNRTAEAYQQYQDALKEMPDYPDKLPIYKRLLFLAQALHKDADVGHYQAKIEQLAFHKGS